MAQTERAKSLLAEDELEPYVRKKRQDGGTRKKMQGLNEQEQNLLRNSINSRERRRMHELNEEFEALRECLPYQNDSSSRRMSKANTLLLASNWIKQLTNANRVLQAELAAARAQVSLGLLFKVAARVVEISESNMRLDAEQFNRMG
ncbi:unnamed protein product [Caenorhabditis auriculariae]|uniref:BHLH domain-containing protein n=1 Tax=Caenorhabditis auriculariae TaxID=2777116 RepID=A0A8S1GMC2_9PELO|nr:unnamed protein product [Caenorhabditis auriculariae]